MSRWSIVLFLLVAACSRERDVTVVVSLPLAEGSAVAPDDFAVVALPYNRDSLVAAFESRASSPRPSTAALESLFAQYRAPFATYTTLTAEAGRYSDSLATLKDRLAGIPRTDPSYGAAYGQWTALRDTLRGIDSQTARARTALETARPHFVARSESLRTVIRNWEDSTYHGYQLAVAELVRSSHREPVADTTGTSGTVVLRLRGGPWWVYARSWDPTDPNAEWYWNIPVTSDTVRLDASTGINRPRY